MESLENKKTRKFICNKLVRNKTSSRLLKDNVFCSMLKIDNENNKEFDILLRKKLLEEAEEVFNSENKKELIEELADLKEVILTLAKLNNISEELIENERIRKYNDRGGFEERVYCSHIDVDINSRLLDYYIKNNDKYPEEK